MQVGPEHRYLRFDDGAIVEAVAFFDSIPFNDFWARVEPG
jgi:ketosteroid isomerase-like protein